MSRTVTNRKGRVLGANGFTLIELIVVMAIISILSVILFRTFSTISELAFRVEQEKNVTEEIIGFSQILQNYADRNTIDYDAYQAGSGSTVLEASKGLSEILSLSGEDGHVSFYSSGDCIQPGATLLSGVQESQCALYLEKNGKVIQLTNPKKTYLSKVMFKIIPFASQEQYLATSGNENNDTLIFSLNKPGFRFFSQVCNARYSPQTRGNNVDIPVQQFFSLK